jgi:hypothetical protein
MIIFKNKNSINRNSKIRNQLGNMKMNTIIKISSKIIKKTIKTININMKTGILISGIIMKIIKNSFHHHPPI